MKPKLAVVTAVFAVIAVILCACGTGPDGSGAGTDASAFATCSPAKGVADAADKPVGDGTLYIGAFVGWDESLASAYLMKNILNRHGYDTEVKTMDVDAAFSATAFGDLDVLTDVWLPTTHQTYLAQYGTRLESLGCWYDNAKLTIAVTNSSPARSIADLETMGGEYDNTIVGIEPGAGETSLITDHVLPAYGLQNMTLRSSSTAEMLAALRQADTDHTNIAVTLWKPHWAYSEFDIRDLADPKGAMGGTDGIWTFATKGLDERSPRAAQMLTNLVLTDAELSDLEDLITQKYHGSDPDSAVIEWLNAHPAYADRLVAGSLG